MIRPRLTPLDWGHLTLSTLAILLSITSSVVFRYKRRGSHYWPSAPGTVEYGLTSDLDGWRTNLVYSYSVNGEFHSGTHTLKARSESHADELAATYKSQRLTVRYSPQNPALSVIRMEDQAPFLPVPVSPVKRVTYRR